MRRTLTTAGITNPRRISRSWATISKSSRARFRKSAAQFYRRRGNGPTAVGIYSRSIWMEIALKSCSFEALFSTQRARRKHRGSQRFFQEFLCETLWFFVPSVSKIISPNSPNAKSRFRCRAICRGLWRAVRDKRCGPDSIRFPCALWRRFP